MKKLKILHNYLSKLHHIRYSIYKSPFGCSREAAAQNSGDGMHRPPNGTTIRNSWVECTSGENSPTAGWSGFESRRVDKPDDIRSNGQVME